ncbi:TPA: acyl-homoserine-lactone synthase [Serratia fonticola]|jgi:acyl homoserine lactone synthase|uniref:Acyl-homoserine-lactone synthase n=1 Tax=Serratia fonticola TaxID=47917 RepID=A0A3S4WS28_SERFO|nr:acyl-homoserine-lactone synthase [Serratia fonticola]CAI1880621.1 Acyl-homoserine-lactone synthase [Serratia fonticola]VEI63197.1 Acyl-homoserine-lactone synthase [Serratia fonticola]HBE9178066.1 acyl-homoserine-lactone synthase [Serratia fonticola]
MLEIFDLNYNSLSERKSEELFALRKDVFKDRLDWAVNCINGLEFDEYDNQNTNYLVGMMNGMVICSVRFIEMQFPNMIEGTFASYFPKLTIPQGNYIESSRFFVDKARASQVNHKKYPISSILFLAMVNYARKYNYDGILTIVSHSMLAILKRSGWDISVIEQGNSEKNQNIYLVHLPTDIESQNTLIERINNRILFDADKLKKWPLICSLN